MNQLEKIGSRAHNIHQIVTQLIFILLYYESMIKKEKSDLAYKVARASDANGDRKLQSSEYREILEKSLSVMEMKHLLSCAQNPQKVRNFSPSRTPSLAEDINNIHVGYFSHPMEPLTKEDLDSTERSLKRTERILGECRNLSKIERVLLSAKLTAETASIGIGYFTPTPIKIVISNITNHSRK